MQNSQIHYSRLMNKELAPVLGLPPSLSIFNSILYPEILCTHGHPRALPPRSTLTPANSCLSATSWVYVLDHIQEQMADLEASLQLPEQGNLGLQENQGVFCKWAVASSYAHSINLQTPHLVLGGLGQQVVQGGRSQNGPLRHIKQDGF